MASQIFISYRRTGGDVTAKLICETLKVRGYTVFYDYDALKGGYFDTRILEAIEDCRDFVLVLPPQGLDRCSDPNDWVRNEIRHALSRGDDINIIPVMLPGFEFPKDLPADIAAVTRFNGVRFAMDYFEAVIGKIEEKLVSKPYGQAAPAPKPQPQPQPTATDDRMQQLLQLASTPEGKALLDSLLKNNATPATPQPQPQSEPKPQPQPAPEPQPEVIPPPPPVISQSSEGLDLQLNESGTEYAVIGIGDCEDTDIVIPKEHEGIPVTSIAENAFYDCYITSVYIPEGVTKIDSDAFCSCDMLEKVYLPDSLKALYGAFKDCKSLASITIPSGTTYISDQEFQDCPGIKAFYVHPDNPQYCNHGPHLFSKDMTCLVRCAPGCKFTDFTIPESVVHISGSAFYRRSDLTRVSIPSKVESIGNYAFCGCDQLAEISLPKNISSIGWSAFKGCKALQSIELPTQLTNISMSAFMSCKSLKNIIIPNRVKRIDEYAFASCKCLESITIPPRVSEIRLGAFSNCNSLTSLQYGGTKEMWSKIDLRMDWNKYSYLKTIHCTDGDILL